jgi:hypothetical protein
MPLPSTTLGNCTSLFEIGIGLAIAGSFARSLTNLITNSLNARIQSRIQLKTFQSPSGKLDQEFTSKVVAAKVAIETARSRHGALEVWTNPINQVCGALSLSLLVAAALFPDECVGLVRFSFILLVVLAPIWWNIVHYFARYGELKFAREKVGEVEQA